MRHSEVQNLLYEYCCNELDNAQRLNIEQHLSSCKRCVNEMRELQQALALLPVPSTLPSNAQNEAFWQSLAAKVEEEIRREPKRDRTREFVRRLIENVRTTFVFRPAYAYAFSGSLAAIILALAVFRWQAGQSPNIAGQEQSAVDTNIELARNASDKRIGEYFRKSKTLLVGIANMKTDDEENFDLNAERKLSRTLVREARYIKQQPMDGRSAKLVQELEKILIELANLETTNDLPNVEMIRSGIHQENLLFKIRMAEALYDTNRTKLTRQVY